MLIILRVLDSISKALDLQNWYLRENIMNVIRAKVRRLIYVITICIIATLVFFGIYRTNSCEGNVKQCVNLLDEMGYQTNSYEGNFGQRVNLFDKSAYQRVLALKGIDNSLCSLVTGLRVSRNKAN